MSPFSPRPLAEPRGQHTLEHLGHVRTDPWSWLRRREDPEVLAYLEAENAYAEAVMAGTEELQRELLSEIVSRIPGDHRTVYERRGGFLYYCRFRAGEELPLVCRRRDSESEEEVLLDLSREAAEHDYFELRGSSPSPGHDRLAYSVDREGRGSLELRIRDLGSGDDLPGAVTGTYGPAVWSTDGEALFHVRLDPGTLRPCRVLRHRPGTPPADDVTVYEEQDDRFRLELGKTHSRRFIRIVSRCLGSSTEVRLLEAGDPSGPLRTFLSRRPGHLYEVDHDGDRFFIRTDDRGPNFRIAAVPEETAAGETWDEDRWSEVVPHREDVLISDFAALEGFLVLVERHAGLLRLRVRRHDCEEHLVAPVDGAVGSVALSRHQEPAAGGFRYVHSSPRRPPTVRFHSVADRRETVERADPVGPGFDHRSYRTELIHAPARDGAEIPVSLVRHRDAGGDPAPLLLHGYGAYGFSLDAAWNPALPSLLDRGFVYAMAHVRGGQERGRAWHEAGRLLHKRNSFWDFIDCAEHLAARGDADPARRYAIGGSAGGLLVAAVVNERPDLFHGAVAKVPFVDVLNTMLDADLPLTTNEYGEWGDPGDPDHFAYLSSYSPYDNVSRQVYPHMLVTAGLHDPFVSYWEPAKLVARLRANKLGDRLLLLRTEMAAGHTGVSGRLARYRETALIYTFLLRLAGLAEVGAGTSPAAAARGAR